MIDYRSWLFPGSDEAFPGAVERHRKKDVETLQNLKGDPRPEASLMSNVAGSEAFCGVPACAGLHLLDWAYETGSQLALNGIRLAAIDVAYGNRSDAELPLFPTATVSFPRLGLTLVYDDSEETIVSADSGYLTITRASGTVRITCEDERPKFEFHGSSPPRTCHKKLMAGIRLEHHWPCLWSVIGGCVDDRMLDDLDPSAEQQFHRAINIIKAADPDLYDEMSILPVWVTPLPRRERDRESFAIRNLPDVVFAYAGNVFDLVDLLCHEFLHLKLFFLEDIQPLLIERDVLLLAPWRRDHRRAEAVLHGTYVFFGVARLFDRIFARWPPSKRGFARLAVWRACVSAACGLLRDAPDVRLTQIGTEMLSGIAIENERALSHLASVDRGLTNWAGEAVRDHLHQAGKDDSEEPWFLGV